MSKILGGSSSALSPPSPMPMCIAQCFTLQSILLAVIVSEEAVIQSATHINDTVVFAVGDTSSIVAIQFVNDGIAVEDVETFILVLGSATSGATIGNDNLGLYATATVSIVDDDRESVVKL